MELKKAPISKANTEAPAKKPSLANLVKPTEPPSTTHKKKGGGYIKVVFPRRSSNKPVTGVKDASSFLSKSKQNINRKSTMDSNKSKEGSIKKVILQDPKLKSGYELSHAYGATTPHLVGTLSPGASNLMTEKRPSSKYNSGSLSTKRLNRAKRNENRDKNQSETHRPEDLQKLDKSESKTIQHEEYGKLSDFIQSEIPKLSESHSANKPSLKAKNKSLEKKGKLFIV